MNTEAECKQATLKMTGNLNFYQGPPFSSPIRPKGCWKARNPPTEFYFNPHSTGSGYYYGRPVCRVGGRHIQHPPHAGAKVNTSHFTPSHLRFHGSCRRFHDSCCRFHESCCRYHESCCRICPGKRWQKLAPHPTSPRTASHNLTSRRLTSPHVT